MAMWEMQGGFRSPRIPVRTHTHTQIYVFSSTPSWRNFSYKLNMKVKDLSGEMTLSGFNNIGLSLFDGMPAEQLVNIQVMRSTKIITPCMYR